MPGRDRRSSPNRTGPSISVSSSSSFHLPEIARTAPRNSATAAGPVEQPAHSASSTRRSVCFSIPVSRSILIATTQIIPQMRAGQCRPAWISCRKGAAEERFATMSTVLVTGGSGFVGVHAVLQLLAAGHGVRTTVRSMGRQNDVLAMLTEGGAQRPDELAFFAADLESDAGWAAATAGCDYVLHVASPMPLQSPKDENDLIKPAREGTLRVLRAARDAGVKRVVVTSSTAAVAYGHEPRPRPFDETDWTDL